MDRLNKLRKVTKVLGMVGFVLISEKVSEKMIPTNPETMRKIVVIASTIILADTISRVINPRIDRYFNGVIAATEADAIGMLG